METYRLILLITLMALSITDLVLTAIYVHTYRSWQPNKPYNLIELNPLLVFLWNTIGFISGMIVGGAIILGLNFYIGEYCHWIIVSIFIVVLIFTIFNHVKNFGLLEELMRRYPSGSLPTKVFGEVIGNN